MTDQLHADVVVACADLADRAGAREFEIGWTCPHIPDAPDDHGCDQTTWNAAASYRGMRIMSGEHRTPSAAALTLAERLLSGGTCRCRQPVSLVDEREGCRWRLVGQRWEPGCDAPPIRMPAGTRGDRLAMQRALEGGNRAQRRAARRKGGADRG